MTLEEIIFIIFRIVGSLPVLWWPFLGGLFAMAVDQSDILLMNVLDLGGVSDYQSLDKYMDQVYMFLFLLVSLRWEPVARNISIGLYAFRMVGTLAFIIAGGDRTVLLFFPNVFEFWFIFVAGIKFFNIDFKYTPARIAASLGILTALKLGQEYTLHHWQILDDITMLEALEWIWRQLTWPFRQVF